MKRTAGVTLGMMCFGFAFLYVPIVLVILYSFNASRLVTVWGGFSTRWYAALLNDGELLDAAWRSVQIAAMSATLALAVGTPAGLALARYGRFRGRALLSAMIAAPLVMPEVIAGLSLLLLFVAMDRAFGWPDGRGMTTITIAHATFCAAYVAVVVQSRLSGMARDLEDAAMDLGARPWKVFVVITLPLISPALAAGWLLGFTLSLDDLVIASFVSGPGSTTLPMKVFSAVRLGVSPEINALATLIVLTVTVVVTAAAFILMRNARGRRRNGLQSGHYRDRSGKP